MMTHHSVMTSSIIIKKIDKFNDFSSDIDYITTSKTDVFRDIISHNHCEPRPQRVPPADTVRQPRSASKRSALVNAI